MTTERFRDPNQPIVERVDDLLGRMTLDEKLAQIGSVWLTDLVKGDRFDAEHVAGKLEHGIGHVTRIGASTGLRPEAPLGPIRLWSERTGRVAAAPRAPIGGRRETWHSWSRRAARAHRRQPRSEGDATAGVGIPSVLGQQAGGEVDGC